MTSLVTAISSSDPLHSLFGRLSMDIVQTETFVVQHGDKARLPAWMRQGPLESVVRLCQEHRGGLQVAQGRTSGPHALAPFMGAGGQTVVQGANAAALLRLGLTVYFTDLQETVPDSRAWLTELEGALGLPPCAGLSAFCNAPGSGLPIHHDGQDQLLIHLIGKKSLTFARYPRALYPRLSAGPESPVARHFGTVYRHGFPDSAPEIEAAGVESVQLEPGSCLFFPAGTWHRTQDQTEPCLSVSVALRAPSRLDLIVNGLRYFAGQSPTLRKPIYGAFPRAHDAVPSGDDTNGSERPLQSFDEDLALLLERLPTLTSQEIRSAWAAPLVKEGEPAAWMASVEFDSYLCSPNLKIHVEAPSPEVLRLRAQRALSLQETVLEFSALARPILDVLLARRRAVSLQELYEQFDDFDEGEIRSFVQQLVRAGVLLPLPTRQWPSI